MLNFFFISERRLTNECECLTFALFQKGDLLMSVNENNLGGLTHSQAVAALKATISLSTVALVAMEVRKICLNSFSKFP